MRQIISYIRVSTQQQGKNELGIEAQQVAIARLAAAEGYELAGEFVEVETGKGCDALERRPQLTAAGHTYRLLAGTRRQALEDALAELSTAIGPPVIKNLATVQAIIKYLGPDAPPASLAPLFALLTPAAVKHNWDLMRGALAAGFAVLRCTEMGTLQMEQWLDEEIKRRALDFTAVEARQLFYECSKGKAKISKTTLESFRRFRPGPSTSLTEAVAKEQVAQILDRAIVMKAGRPLTRPRRRS